MPHRDSFAILMNKLRNITATTVNGRVTMVAFGDSVTLGLTTNPELLHEQTYHACLRAELAREFPTTAFSTINAGVNGDSTAGALRRIQSDVLDHHPDLVIVAFGLNDSGGGKEGLPRFTENLETIVRQSQNAGAGVILLTPNLMATHDNGHVDPNYRHVLTAFIERQKSGALALYAERIRQVGTATGAPVADVYAEWERRQARGEDMIAHLANGLNHPDAFGHQIAAALLWQAVLRQLEQKEEK